MFSPQKNPPHSGGPPATATVVERDACSEQEIRAKAEKTESMAACWHSTKVLDPTPPR